MIPIKGSAPSPKTPWVTILLIVANLAVFLFEISLPRPDLEAVLRTWGFVPAQFWRALAEQPAAVEIWLVPIFTSIFMHGGWGHVIGNMLFLWVFGDGIENRIGSLRFLMFYLLAGAAASIVHAAAGPGLAVPTIGASGAVAGVLGAYLLLHPASWVVLLVPIFIYPLFFRVPTVFFLGFWFLQQLFFGAATVATQAGEAAQAAGGVAWWAHAGGFVFGLLVIKFFCIGKTPPEPKERPRLFPGRNAPRSERRRHPRDQIL